MSFYFRWAACAALVFVPCSIHGAVIVTATLTPLSADEAMTQMIVIDCTEIEAAQAHDVAELLRLHAGIEVARNGGRPGQATSVFVHDTESNHVLILVDGVKVNPATIGGALLPDLDPALIERIEIVNGPYSGLYGSEAIGGVIQIFTCGTRITGGSFGTACPIADFLVAGEPRGRFQTQRTAHQGPLNRNHGDVALLRERWPFGTGFERLWLQPALRPADMLSQNGQDDFQLLRNDQQWRPDDPGREMDRRMVAKSLSVTTIVVNGLRILK